MKLTMFDRKIGKKSEATRMRREGKILAILYGPKTAPRAIAVSLSEVQALLRSLQPQMLATTVIELATTDAVHRVLIKEVAYHPTSYHIEHIDFLLLSDEAAVTVNVPIRLQGAVDCIGVKLGGFLRPVIRALKVRCLPKQLPAEFVLDVQNLEIGQSKRLSDIAIPEGIKPLAPMNEVAVVIAKKV